MLSGRLACDIWVVNCATRLDTNVRQPAPAFHSCWSFSKQPQFGAGTKTVLPSTSLSFSLVRIDLSRSSTTGLPAKSLIIPPFWPRSPA